MSTETNNSLSQQQIQVLEKALPLWKIIFNQFIEHRMAVIGSFIIIFYVLVALFADVISTFTGIDPQKQNVSARYLQPLETSEYSIDMKENSSEAWVEGNPQLAEELRAQIKTNNWASVPAAAEDEEPQDLVVAFGSLPAAEIQQKLQGDTSAAAKSFSKMVKLYNTYHVFGTDEVGRDVLIRLIHGTRVSIGVGVLVAVASALIGLLIGSIAGFYGGIIDTLLMRLTDALLSLPLVPVLIVIAAVDLQKLPAIKALMRPDNESIVKMFIILCFFSWMTVARLVRGSILSLREREFVLAAKTLGAKDRTIIIKHMFPNVIAPMLVAITLGVGNSILFESALSFLGLGIMPPTASWGNMLNNALEVMYKNVWLCVLPGLMILFTTISFNFVGDGLQDAVDPKSIRR